VLLHDQLVKLTLFFFFLAPDSTLYFLFTFWLNHKAFVSHARFRNHFAQKFTEFLYSHSTYMLCYFKIRLKSSNFLITFRLIFVVVVRTSIVGFNFGSWFTQANLFKPAKHSLLQTLYQKNYRKKAFISQRFKSLGKNQSLN